MIYYFIFSEEPPFVFVGQKDPVSGKCSINRGVPCRIPIGSSSSSSSSSSSFGGGGKNGSNFLSEEEELGSSRCCSGLLIDLLRKFTDELGFSYDLVRVEDPKWGSILPDGSWNGLMGELVSKKTDMVLSAMKVSKM